MFAKGVLVSFEGSGELGDNQDSHGASFKIEGLFNLVCFRGLDNQPTGLLQRSTYLRYERVFIDQAVHCPGYSHKIFQGIKSGA